MPYADPAKARAMVRNRAHMRRTTVSDITAAQELAMRKKARKCPLCGVRMTDKPHLPNSKELAAPSAIAPLKVHVMPPCVLVMIRPR